MSASLTPEAYHRILQVALRHVLEGGGIVPHAESNVEQHIEAVAVAHFGAGEARSTLEQLLARTFLADPLRDEIREAVYGLIGCNTEAAFIFGCAVSTQIRRPVINRRARPAKPASSHRKPRR